MTRKSSPLTQNERNLIRRYLIWCYKTTKEDLDRIDRYFTQSKADNFVLMYLKKIKEYRAAGAGDYKGLVDQFQVYMGKKTANAVGQKFKDKGGRTVRPPYQYLTARLEAIRQAIRHFLGSKALTEIVRLYEQEMTRRILEAREHT